MHHNDYKNVIDFFKKLFASRPSDSFLKGQRKAAALRWVLWKRLIFICHQLSLLVIGMVFLIEDQRKRLR